MSGMAHGVRLRELLSVFNLAEAVTTPLVAQTLDWDKEKAGKVLSNAMAHGYVENTGEKDERKMTLYRLTEKGQAKRALNAGAAAVDETVKALATKASELILAAAGGMASDALSDELGVPSIEVETALALHAKHRFVTCKVWRNGDDFIHYRESASVAHEANDWKKTGASVPVQGVIVQGVEERRVPAPPVLLPDILDTVTPPEETEELPANVEQFFSLYSTGELLIQRAGGEQVFLDRDETRALFQWLDRLGGLNLERLTLPQDDEVPA